MKNKNNLKVLSLKIKFLYLTVLFICLVATGICFYYENGTGIEICCGILSGTIVSLVTSFTLSGNRDSGDDIDDAGYEHLLGLLKDANENKEKFISGISVYADAKNDGLDIGKIISSAKKRVWILGTDLSSFTIKHGKRLTTVCTENPEINVRILSLHPKNLFCSMRYGEIGWDNAVAMSTSVNDACFAVKEIERSIQAVHPEFKMELRLYLCQPTVCLYLIDDTLIVSHFMNGVRVSDSVQILCDINKHEGIAQNFVTKHFEDVWSDAIDIDKDIELPHYDPLYTIHKNGKATHYQLKKKYSAVAELFGRMGLWFKRVGHSLREHIPSLLTPLLFSVFGLCVLAVLYLNPATRDTLLGDQLTNMSLGFISGSLLSSFEYVISVRYEAVIREEERERVAVTSESLCQTFSSLLGANCREYGVSFAINRNEAKIKERILAAKKRVWIYATNHKYISSLGIDTYLKNNDLDARFLMLSPQSLFVSTRYSEIPGKKHARDFAEEIASNLQHLANEYKSCPSVEARVFSEHPTFMMYLIDDVLILSHILRQGRARDQVHFIFDLRFPDIQYDTVDYIEHFKAVWNRAERCTQKTARFQSAKPFITIKDDSMHVAEGAESIPISAQQE